MGNAAFHSNSLYEELSVCMQPLAVALNDSDDKTRANTAGAIGNLIRNGGELSGLMASLLIPSKLARVILLDPEVTPKRIALFSLGTMAVYASTR